MRRAKGQGPRADAHPKQDITVHLFLRESEKRKRSSYYQVELLFYVESDRVRTANGRPY